MIALAIRLFARPGVASKDLPETNSQLSGEDISTITDLV